MKRTLVITFSLVVAVIAGFVLQKNLSNGQDSPAMQQQLSSTEESPVAQQTVTGITELHDYQGQLSAWDGDARLVNFWATWCAPCRREIPLLKQLQNDKPEKQLQVVGIAVDYMEDVVAYAEQAQFNYPILVGQEEAMDAAASSGVDFIGLPFTLIVAGDGSLVSTHMGELHQQHVDHIAAIMKKLESGAMDLDSARRELGTL